MIQLIGDLVALLWLVALSALGLRLVQRTRVRQGELEAAKTELSPTCPSCFGTWGKWAEPEYVERREYNAYGPDYRITSQFQSRTCEECGYVDRRKLGESRGAW